MKNKLIASILTLSLIGGGTVTPAFADTKDNLLDNAGKCSVSGSLLQNLSFKKIWFNNCNGGIIIIGGTVNKPNDDNNNTIIPPEGDIEKPIAPSVPEETPDNKPSVPEDKPIIDDNKPNIPEDKPIVDETPDNSINNDINNVDTNFMSSVERAIYNKVNEERAKVGAKALTYNDTMQKYARIKSKDMGDNNYFSHEDLKGNLITTQMKNDGVSYKAWGENIAYIGGNASADYLAEQFMNNWMNSSGHRANILSTNFSSIGIGVYKIGDKVYATQEFYR